MTSNLVKKSDKWKRWRNSDWWYRSLATGKLSSKKNNDNIEREDDERKSDGYEWWKGLWWKILDR